MDVVDSVHCVVVNVEKQANQRFPALTGDQKNEMLANKSAKSTQAATNYAKSVFHDYCKARHGYKKSCVIDTLQVETLDSLLESFYAEARNKKGEKYSCQTLRSLRSGIQRYYNELPLRRGFNMINGGNFSSSRAMFEAVCADMKKSGLGNVAHKPVIADDDLERIRNYFSTWESNNLVLQRKVWLDLMLHCCRRSREGLRELKKDSYIVKKDGNGRKFIVKNGSEVTKYRRSDQEGIIYEDNSNEYCAVKSFEFFMQKLNPRCDALFQRPRDNFSIDDDVWFENKPLGKNSLGSLMLNISKAAELSKSYTNHSLRFTSIIALDIAGFEGRENQTVSKHKSIDRYCEDTSFPKKKRMTSTLTNVLHKKSADGTSPICNSENKLSVVSPTNALPAPANTQPFPANALSVTNDSNELDMLNDSVLSPDVGRVLNEINSQQVYMNINTSTEKKPCLPTRLPQYGKRLSLYAPDTGENSALPLVKEKILDVLSKSSLDESSLIELLNWMRSLILVNGGSCNKTKGLYYLAEVENQAPKAKEALDEIVIPDSRVQFRNGNPEVDDSTNGTQKINVSLHLEYHETLQNHQIIPAEPKQHCTLLPKVTDPVNYMEVSLGKRKHPNVNNCTDVLGGVAIPVTLVRVDNSQNQCLVVLNNADNKSTDVGEMNTNTNNQSTCFTENKEKENHSSTEMDSASIPNIKLEPVEADSCKTAQFSNPETSQEMEPASMCTIEFQIKQEPFENEAYEMVPLCNIKNEPT